MTREQTVTALSRWTAIQPWLGRAGLAAYLIVLVSFIARNGLPTDRVDQTIWILIGIVAAKLGRNWRLHVRAVVDWVPLLGALLLYDYSRGIADTFGMPVRVTELVDVERALFGGTIPTVWLQDQFYTPGVVRWWDVAAGVIYMSHFIVPWALAAGFYIASRTLWWRYIRMVLLLSYAGLLTYILLPAAPPWYASSVGVIEDHVHRNATAGWWEVIGLPFAGTWFDERVQADSNAVAALPSLHAGFALLVCIGLWPIVRHWLPRILLAAFPVSMSLTLIYGGEHYAIDVLLGFVYVGLILLGLRLWDRWWQEPRAPQPPGEESRPLTEPSDLADQVTGPSQVGRPNEQPVPARSLGHGVPDAGVEQNVLNRAQVVDGDPLSDGYEQPVLRATIDQGFPLPKRPTRNQD